MHSFIQRNKKKLLAVFGVLLMIVFLLPATFGPGQNDRSDQPYGKMGDETIPLSEVEQAKIDLEEFRELGFRPLQTLAPQPSARGQSPVEALFKDPHLYVLLQREAAAAGVAPGTEEVDQLHRETFPQYQNMWVRNRAGGGATPEKMRSMANNATEMGRASEALRASIRRFLLVQNNFARVSAAAKVSPPQVRELVARNQAPVVNVVEFPATQYAAEVPPPTTQRVMAHYAQFADRLPDERPAGPATQPTFGYRQPEKVRFQYLTVPYEEVIAATVGNLSGDELDPIDEVAKAYYDANAAEFTPPPPPPPPPEKEILGPTTAATRPATQPATAPAAPTTRPLAEVLDDLRKKVAGPDDPKFQQASAGLEPAQAEKLKAVRGKIAKEATRLQDELRSRMLMDFGHYQAGRPLTFAVKPVEVSSATTSPATAATSGPSSAPAVGPAVGPATAPAGTRPAATQPASTRPAAPSEPGPFTRPPEFYPTLEYLDSVAADFHKQYRVRPRVTQVGKDLTKAELSAEINIGSASTRPPESTPFAELVTRVAPTTAPATTAPTTSTATATATAPATTTPATSAAAATRPTTAPAVAATPLPPVSTQPTKSIWALYEPLPVLAGSTDDAYIARLTKYEGGRAPSLDEVRPKIEEDLRGLDALAAAEAAAKRFQSAIGSPAQGRPEGGAPVMAADVGQKVLVLGPITEDRPALDDYPLSPESAERFHGAAMRLRAMASTADLHPSTVVGLPAERKAVVVELRELRRDWLKPDDFTRQVQLADQIVSREVADLAGIWFDPTGIVARTKFTPARGN